jgi:hypothetical protein
MRALSIRQPWAWAILHAGKDVENRSWHNKHTVGVIAVHASMGLDPLEELPRGVRRRSSDELVHGAIVGVVEVVKVVDNCRSRWFKGPLGWLLRHPRPLQQPILCKGALGLWEVPPRVARAIQRELKTSSEGNWGPT